jgi:hypothetical protein
MSCKDLMTRYIRSIRARLGRFQPGINGANFDAAREYLDSLGYDGPLSLSWDDTKCHPALRSYYDGPAEGGVWRLAGCNGITPVFTTYDELMALTEAHRSTMADKVRVWILGIPYPGFPPIVLAIMAIHGKTSQATLDKWHTEVEQHLLTRRIHHVSASADGTQVERGMQQNIVKRAIQAKTIRSWEFEYSEADTSSPNPPPPVPQAQSSDKILKKPHNDIKKLTLVCPMINGHPQTVQTDGKHAKKNGRGAIMSGARFLALGDFPIFFALLRELANRENGPLYIRDIEGVDKQDDRAAARLFSAAVIEYLAAHQQHELGLSIYLFIIGEVVDAQQNRHITHSERWKMLLRARFFFDAWKEFIIQHPDYGCSTHYVSREYDEIVRMFIDGLLILTLIHRDYYPSHPFLPWLHSTEINEHFFGVNRKINKDFTFLEMIYMVVKVKLVMMGDFKHSGQADANAQRHGYHHSYFDSTKLDLAKLRQFPSDSDIAKVIPIAKAEALALLAILGITPVAGGSNPSGSTKPRSDQQYDVRDKPEQALDEYNEEKDDDSSLPAPDSLDSVLRRVDTSAFELGPGKVKMATNLAHSATALVLDELQKMYVVLCSLPSEVSDLR